MLQAQHKIEWVDRPRRQARTQLEPAKIITLPGQLKRGAPGKAMLAHRITLPLDADMVVGRLAHDGKQYRRAPGPERGIAIPQPGLTIAAADRLHFGPERRHRYAEVFIADFDIAHHCAPAAPTLALLPGQGKLPQSGQPCNPHPLL